MPIVIALSGNALPRHRESSDAEIQRKNVLIAVPKSACINQSISKCTFTQHI